MKPLHKFLENGASIEIGEFTIRELKDGSFFIERESGEGIEVAEDELEDLIFDFYKESF
jgi:hypothetical protein